jgi:hypothetical protein
MGPPAVFNQQPLFLLLAYVQPWHDGFAQQASWHWW